MTSRTFLDAAALGDTVTVYERMVVGLTAQSTALDQAAAAAPDVLALAGLDGRFVAGGSTLPPVPTAAELSAAQARGRPVSGAYRPGALLQRVQWETATNTWVPQGAPLISSAALAGAGLRPNSFLASLPVGPVGVPEGARDAILQTGSLRAERITYGFGLNAVVRSTANLPGARTQVLGIGNWRDLSWYGDRDHVLDFGEFTLRSDDSYNVATGAATYTATSLTASGIPFDLLDTLQPTNMVVDTQHDPKWSGVITGWDRATNRVTVSGWVRCTPGATPASPGPVGTPANGVPAIINPATKGWIGNFNYTIDASAPTAAFAGFEYGAINKKADSRVANGTDWVAFGQYKVGTAFLARRSAQPGNENAGWLAPFVAQGAIEASYTSENDPLTDAPPLQDFRALGTGQIGFVSAGIKNFHFLAQRVYQDTTTNLFSVDNDGNLFVAGALNFEGVLEVKSGVVDLHLPGDNDYTTRLRATPGGGLQINEANALTDALPVLVAQMDQPDPFQDIAAGAFVKLRVNARTDTRETFDATDHSYVIPETGIYQIEMKMRPIDSTPAGVSYGLGADPVLNDSAATRWTNTTASSGPNNRQGHINQRTARFEAGQRIYLYTYADAAITVSSAELIIIRIR